MANQSRTVTVKVDAGGKYTIARLATAAINSKACVNCGTCREYCPVGAISEQQRAICRLCPECSSKPAMTVEEMFALPTQKACTGACPVGISPQGYVGLIKAGKEGEAYKLIWEKNPLPSVCGRICHHPCEQDCKRGIIVDEPITIRALKRYLSDSVPYEPVKYPRIHEEKIAVIGAGPAGLTAAHYLAQAGYEVTVFDAEAQPGGMLTRGIPTFRLPHDVVSKDIENIAKAGITFVLGERLGKAGIEKIKQDYDAVVVATGAPNSKELKIEGWRFEGIVTALDFMERANNRQDLWRYPAQLFKTNGEVVVIGGGNVAMTAARTAVRLGAKKATVVCVESGEALPCHAWEKDETEEEGVVVMEGWAPQRYVGNHPELAGVEVCKVKSFAKDSCGVISFDVDKKTVQTVKADFVIVAIGQAPDQLWDAYEKDDKVFFAGDVRSQACSVVNAMASGKKVALAIDKQLRGREAKDVLALRTLNLAPLMEKIYPATRLKTPAPAKPLADAAQRVKSFAEVEATYAPETADLEVLRCLQCGYQAVDTDKCIGCGVCQRVCPKGDVITMVAATEGGE